MFNLHTENDNNFGYEKITILVDNMPLNGEILCQLNTTILEYQFLPVLQILYDTSKNTGTDIYVYTSIVHNTGFRAIFTLSRKSYLI